ncbi:MAG: c-type cytochrome [Pseudohongiella sp.]|uniref:cytochrome c n=1 Tax=Pseudohongiella sp. TaxID=1979412 RepID=UPI0034A05424
MKKLTLLTVMLGLLGCNTASEPEVATGPAASGQGLTEVTLDVKPGTGRWYTEAQVERGRKTFGQYCAACHGANAEATPNWRTLDANGNYPPPPLNGSAHAWHHPLAVLSMVIEEGGEPMGGVMPAWGDTLGDADIVEVIASFQSYWPEEIYDLWLERERASRGLSAD